MECELARLKRGKGNEQGRGINVSKGHGHFGELEDEWLGWAVESQENTDERKPEK